MLCYFMKCIRITAEENLLSRNSCGAKAFFCFTQVSVLTSTPSFLFSENYKKMRKGNILLHAGSNLIYFAAHKLIKFLPQVTDWMKYLYCFLIKYLERLLFGYLVLKLKISIFMLWIFHLLFYIKNKFINFYTIFNRNATWIFQSKTENIFINISQNSNTENLIYE